MRGLATVAPLLGIFGTHAVALDPPNSLRPERTTGVVRVKHHHRIARNCTAQGSADGLRCNAQLESGDPVTIFRLLPVRIQRITRQPDDREPVNVSVGPEGVPEGGPISLGPGRWEIAWADYPQRKNFSLDAGGTTNILLETITGRCEKVARQCVLVPKTITKKVDVSE